MYLGINAASDLSLHSTTTNGSSSLSCRVTIKLEVEDRTWPVIKCDRDHATNRSRVTRAADTHVLNRSMLILPREDAYVNNGREISCIRENVMYSLICEMRNISGLIPSISKSWVSNLIEWFHYQFQGISRKEIRAERWVDCSVIAHPLQLHPHHQTTPALIIACMVYRHFTWSVHLLRRPQPCPAQFAILTQFQPESRLHRVKCWEVLWP